MSTTRRSAGSAAVPWPALEVRRACARSWRQWAVRARGGRVTRTASSNAMRPVASRWRRQHQRERGDEPLGVGELGEAEVGRAGPRHRPADVEHHGGAEVGLLLVLLHVQPVVAAQHLPVDVAQLVAGLVHPVLGELDREAAPGRPVQSGQEAFDHTFGHELEPAEARDVHRIEQIETGAPGGRLDLVHRARNVLARPGGVNAGPRCLRRGTRGGASSVRRHDLRMAWLLLPRGRLSPFPSEMQCSPPGR